MRQGWVHLWLPGLLAMAAFYTLAMTFRVYPAETGFASVYWADDGGELSHILATGHRYDPNTLTAAHRTLPLGSIVQVTHQGIVAYIQLNDRGPCASRKCQATAPKRIKERIIDFTPAAADQIRLEGLGKVTVRPCRIVWEQVEDYKIPIRVCS